MLSEADRERVAAAVREAEALTAGEIVVVVAARSSSYRSTPVIAALLAALAFPWPLVWFTDMAAGRIFIAQLMAALAMALVLIWVSGRVILAPRFVRHARAREAAEREFRARGLARTRDRTGVLIYVALAEHHAEVIADAGIYARVDDGVWREAVEVLVENIAAGRTADGLVAAVGIVGRVLELHAPPKADDADELPNRVLLI